MAPAITAGSLRYAADTGTYEGGEVVFSIPLYGYLFDAAATPVGRLLIVGPALLLLGIELRQYLHGGRP